jgi:hypothetical protein
MYAQLCAFYSGYTIASLRACSWAEFNALVDNMNETLAAARG